MRIAFRYNDLPKVNSVQTLSNIGHYFDLTKQIDVSTIENHDISYWGEENSKCPRKQQLFHNPKYLSLLDTIRAKTKQDCFSLANDGKEKNILRVCINSLGSPLWYDSNFGEDICKFLVFLKSIVRQSQTVCCITIPAHLLDHLDGSPGLLQRIRHFVDYSIHLEAFAGSDRETNPYFKEYNGLLNIRKLTALNTFAPFTPETHDLAFKLRRKKFVIEKLHLPPELQESEQRGQDEVLVNCGSMSKSKLDF
jgi:elongator complex protein 4